MTASDLAKFGELWWVDSGSMTVVHVYTIGPDTENTRVQCRLPSGFCEPLSIHCLHVTRVMARSRLRELVTMNLPWARERLARLEAAERLLADPRVEEFGEPVAVTPLVGCVPVPVEL